MKRRKKYVSKVGAGTTAEMKRDICILKNKTGKSEAALLREALQLLKLHYKEKGF